MRSLRNLHVGLLLLAAAHLPGCMEGNTSSSSSSSGGSATVAQVSGASPLSASCGNTVPTGASETFTSGSGIQPQVAAIPGGAVVGVWEEDRWTGFGSRAILTSASSDNGATWSTPIVLPFSTCGGGAGPGAGYDRTSDPWITFAGNGVLVASALAFSANGFTSNGFTAGGLSAVLVSRSTDGGATWSTPAAVIQDTNPVNATAFYFNDRDSITADSFGNVYVVWDRLTSGTNASGVTNSEPAWIAISSDGGATWPATGANAAHVLYDPGAGNEAFNSRIVVLPNGNLLDFFTLISGGSSFSLELVASTDHGATWSTTPVTVAAINSVGTQNPIAGGPAIRDSWVMAQIAVDPSSGNVAAVWQQSFNSTFDGIALSVSTDGGATWASPRQINGAPAAAAFSPTVRYLPGGVLAVTYYDLRDYASGSTVLSTGTWLTESADGGATWHEVRLQNTFDMNKAPLTDNNRPFGISPALFLGDNQGLALVGSNPLPLYAAAGGNGAHVYAARPADPLTSSTAHVYNALP
jgi:hypothetical protein